MIRKIISCIISFVGFCGIVSKDYFIGMIIVLVGIIIANFNNIKSIIKATSDSDINNNFQNKKAIKKPLTIFLSICLLGTIFSFIEIKEVEKQDNLITEIQSEDNKNDNLNKDTTSVISSNNSNKNSIKINDNNSDTINKNSDVAVSNNTTNKQNNTQEVNPSVQQPVQNDTNEITVYWGKTGTKYHRNPNCRSFKGNTPYSGTIEEAIAAGRTDWCGICSK